MTLFLDGPRIPPSAPAPISLFRDPIEDRSAIDALAVQSGHQDVKLMRQDGFLPRDTGCFYFKNESVPLKLLIDLNGVDARYDAGHIHGDTDLHWRMVTAGWNFFLDKRATSEIVQVRHLMGTQVFTASLEDNYRIWADRRLDRDLRTPGSNLRALWTALHVREEAR